MSLSDLAEAPAADLRIVFTTCITNGIWYGTWTVGYVCIGGFGVMETHSTVV